MFISFEGTEGVGKTTLINGVADYLSEQGVAYVRTREPGGTPFAENIRALLLAQSQEPIASDCELLLMFAARAQHIEQVILPALARKQWVLCDRFVDSSYAYQCAGRGISQHKLDALCAHFVSVMPSKTFWLDAPVELGMQRAQQRGELDRFEQEKREFFQRVRQQYAVRQQAAPDRVVRLDASMTPAQILMQTIAMLTFESA